MPYEVLWYAVIAMAILFYIILDGFDLGVGSLHLFGKTDLDRRIFLNAIGPVWDGNEVWIVVVMGGLFAGFPNVYATLFSGFYTLLMFLIAGLMFRAAAIEFRSKQESLGWRRLWDTVFCISSVLVAFVLGVVLGNVIRGIPLDSEQNFVGTFADFFHPYPILVGITAVALFSMHGAIYLAMKTEGETHRLVLRWIPRTLFFLIACYSLTTAATLRFMPHMTDCCRETPYFIALPLLSFATLFNILYQTRKGNHGWAFVSSCVSIALLLFLFGIGTFPKIVYSTIDPAANSLTIYNTSSSRKTLGVLLIVVAIGIPLILAYCGWVYRIFRGKVRIGKSSY